MNATVKNSLRVDVALLKEFKQSADFGKMFAVVDACDEPLVPSMMDDLGDRALSLYRGQAQRDYWAIAPYLCRVDADLLDWMIENLWSHAWGFLFESTVELPDLHAHFRRFIMIRQNGKLVYFRFYDPRVLRPFLMACNEDEIKKFFGPVERFGTNPDAETIQWIGRDRS